MDVDLNNCDREPIHIPGRVQPFGFLLVVTARNKIVAASTNAGDYLDRSGAVVGTALNDLFSAEAMRLVGERSRSDMVERIFSIKLRADGAPFDIAIHRSGSYTIIEGEPAEISDGINSGDVVRAMLARIRHTASFDAFCREAARQVQTLTGFDRVMIYRFDPDGAGEVIAEIAPPTLESFLGLHYPATDIPRQARLLYERNWIRIIADVDSEPASLEPATIDGVPFDLSMSVLRAVSPIHIEYLRNMGVKASLSISILRDGKLWGLIACHHYAPRLISFERRTAAELFGQMFSWILESREREQEVAYEGRARELHNRMMAALASRQIGPDTFSGLLDSLSEIIDCDGVAVWQDGEVTVRGTAPPADEIVNLANFLGTRSSQEIVATNEIGSVYPAGRKFVERAAGMLAVPISLAARSCLFFFRTEIARPITWAGNPHKPVSLEPSGERLSPRKSFEAWREVVRGQSSHWTPADLRIAESLRVTLLEVIFELTDAAEREHRAAQERQEFLIAELNHRVRNILGLIRSLVSKGQYSGVTTEQFASVVGGRIQALARAHDLLTETNRGPGDLRMLIEAETAAYLGDKGARVIDSGPDVSLEPEAFPTMALVIHELVTNSVKYGALGAPAGIVRIDWDIEESGTLVIHWQESGGPPVEPPSRRGFGSTIVERSIPYELGGRSEVLYTTPGVQVRLAIPARFVHISGSAAAQPSPEKATQPVSMSLSGPVLVVEDNLIIAMDAETILERLGATKVDLASSSNAALTLIAENRPSFALLDINLGKETSIPVASKLRELDVPFAFASGYGESASVIPPELQDIPVVLKPHSIEAIIAVLPRRADG